MFFLLPSSIGKSYADLTYAERHVLCARHLKAYQEENRSTTPDDKDIINASFVHNIPIGRGAKVAFLDHADFKTAYALLEQAIRPEDMVIPQRDAELFCEMSQHELFGASVRRGNFNEILHCLLADGMAFNGIYADYCSTLKSDWRTFISLMNAYRANLVQGAVICITIPLCNREGVRCQDGIRMEKLFTRGFPNQNIILEDDLWPTYCFGDPIAPWMIKL